MSRTAILYLDRLESGVDGREVIAATAGALELAGVVRDEHDTSRDGLAAALERVAAGEASTLVVSRLGAAAGSLRETVALLD